MKISHKNNLKKWKRKNSFDKKFGSKNPPSYPHEMLLRVCLSKRFTNIEFNIKRVTNFFRSPNLF